MRVLWLSHLVPYPPKGGMLQRAYHLLRELSLRHEVHAVCFNQRALLPDAGAVEDARKALSEFTNILSVHDIPSDFGMLGRHGLAARSYLHRVPFTIAWLESDKFRQAVSRAVESLAPDVVHFDTISLAQYLEQTPGRLCVLNHHNIESTMMGRRAELERHPLKRHYFATEARLLRSYEQRIAKRFDLHLTCSDLDSERLGEICPGNTISTVPNGVDIGYFRPFESGAQEEEQSLLFAGGLNWYPNVSAVRFIIESLWPLVKREFPKASLTVVGRNPPAWLKRAAESDPMIRVPGFVDDIRPYMDRAAVYLCPIFDGGGTKLKVLDAMAMAKPLVANPISMEGIDATPNHHWIPATSPSEFVSGIRRLFSDATLRREMGNRARDLICDRYSFAQIGQELSERLEEHVRARKPG